MSPANSRCTRPALLARHAPASRRTELLAAHDLLAAQLGARHVTATASGHHIHVGRKSGWRVFSPAPGRAGASRSAMADRERAPWRRSASRYVAGMPERVSEAALQVGIGPGATRRAVPELYRGSDPRAAG